MTSQTVVITGASRGLGAAAARIAGQMKANVVLMARTERDLRSVSGEIQEAGGQALPLVGDIGRAADCKRVITETISQFGQLDALVNTVGVLAPIAPIATGDPEAWRRNWVVNMLGPLMLAQAALPHLRQCKGRLINVSSRAGIHTIEGWGAYGVSKAALNHFTRMMAAEEPDITSMAFRPGIVDRAMQATDAGEGVQGVPEEVVASFLRRPGDGDHFPPEVPGCALAVLAFHAPHEWSGTLLAWNDEPVQSLIRQFGCSYGA
jgi:NAD(P)-dependent dehydrogenase (short-subunit alcohol dehydrogenase family)